MTPDTSGADQAAPLHVQRDARGVVTLTLNDPARFNALGGEMLAALQQALDDVARDESARVVVLAAQGKAFCAGHNLKEMAAHPDLAWYQRLFAQCSRVMLSIHQLPVPVIAQVQGMATATRGLSRMDWTSCSTSADRLAAGTTRLSRPCASAVGASMKSPVSSISMARLAGMLRTKGTLGVAQNRP